MCQGWCLSPPVVQEFTVATESLAVDNQHHFIQSSQELSLFLLLKMRRLSIGRLSDLSQVPELLSGKKLGVQTHMDLIPKPVC